MRLIRILVTLAFAVGMFAFGGFASAQTVRFDFEGGHYSNDPILGGVVPNGTSLSATVIFEVAPGTPDDFPDVLWASGQFAWGNGLVHEVQYMGQTSAGSSGRVSYYVTVTGPPMGEPEITGFYVYIDTWENSFQTSENIGDLLIRQSTLDHMSAGVHEGSGTSYRDLDTVSATFGYGGFVGRLPATAGGTDYRAYYDPQADLTWVANANINGPQLWPIQIAWAAGLVIDDIHDWRLPKIDSNGDGVIVNCADASMDACKDNEFGFLYHKLGVTAASPAPFDNVRAGQYWADNLSGLRAWTFNFNTGATQLAGFPDFGTRYGWAVRDGDPFSPMAAKGDINGDGKSDILWRHSVSGMNWAFLMDGTSVTDGGLVNQIADPNWKIVGRGDYNGDGKADLLWRHILTGQNWMHLLNGTEVISGGSVNQVSDLNWQVVGSGDANGDGKSDIFWHNGVSGQTWLYTMNGTAVLQSAPINRVPDLNWKVVGNGDANGDGKADLFWRNAVTGQNWCHVLSSAQVVDGGLINVVPDPNWKIVGNSDYNGDGKADLLWRHADSGQTWMHLLNGTEIIGGGQVNVTTDQNWRMADDGDYNGDGKADVLWRNASTGQNWIHYLSGTQVLGGGPVNPVSDPAWQIVNTY